ncbi:MAG: thrombospondin type 3 repeat-containing protein [Nanoarchaeota archaeon]|nr:thrombospondin type 3 repeat-containing protein [Nanoarchaeota archaeon]
MKSKRGVSTNVGIVIIISFIVLAAIVLILLIFKLYVHSSSEENINLETNSPESSSPQTSLSTGTGINNPNCVKADLIGGEGFLPNAKVTNSEVLWVKSKFTGGCNITTDLDCGRADVNSNWQITNTDVLLENSIFKSGNCVITPPSCYDKDNGSAGISLLNRTTVYGVYSNGMGYKFSDYCTNDGIVEYFCSGNNINQTTELCAFGSLCVNGACVNSGNVQSCSEFDIDGDGVSNSMDNCIFRFNTDQADIDNDTWGDVCDLDGDNDGVSNALDNCLDVANADQTDSDFDGLGDVCDIDNDNDLINNTLDNCQIIWNADQSDYDNDSRGDVCDNCPEIFNPDQRDSTANGVGDACDLEGPQGCTPSQTLTDLKVNVNNKPQQDGPVFAQCWYGFNSAGCDNITLSWQVTNVNANNNGSCVLSSTLDNYATYLEPNQDGSFNSQLNVGQRLQFSGIVVYNLICSDKNNNTSSDSLTIDIESIGWQPITNFGGYYGVSLLVNGQQHAYVYSGATVNIQWQADPNIYDYCVGSDDPHGTTSLGEAWNRTLAPTLNGTISKQISTLNNPGSGYDNIFLDCYRNNYWVNTYSAILDVKDDPGPNGIGRYAGADLQLRKANTELPYVNGPFIISSNDAVDLQWSVSGDYVVHNFLPDSPDFYSGWSACHIYEDSIFAVGDLGLFPLNGTLTRQIPVAYKNGGSYKYYLYCGDGTSVDDLPIGGVDEVTVIVIANGTTVLKANNKNSPVITNSPLTNISWDTSGWLNNANTYCRIESRDFNQPTIIPGSVGQQSVTITSPPVWSYTVGSYIDWPLPMTSETFILTCFAPNIRKQSEVTVLLGSSNNTNQECGLQ